MSLLNFIQFSHPCSEKPSVVADFGLRISEGLSDLKIDQQLAPTREVISRTLTTGSTNFFKAVEGVRERWMQRNPSSTSNTSPTSDAGSPTKVDDAKTERSEAVHIEASRSRDSVASTQTKPLVNGLRALSMSVNRPPPEPTKPILGGWGTGIGSFFSQRVTRMSMTGNTDPSSRRSSVEVSSRTSSPARPEKVASLAPSVSGLTANVSEHDKENNAWDEGAQSRNVDDELATSGSRQSVQSAGVGFAL